MSPCGSSSPMRRLLLPCPLALCLLLPACQGESSAGGGGRDAAEYTGEPGTWLELGTVSDPAATPHHIYRLEETTWTVREGTEWSTAEDLAEYTVDTSEGLVVDGQRLLPARLAEGESQDGAEVLTIGEEEVYYGLFSDAVRVSVGSGTWAGEHVFAPGVGLIYTTVEGESWELVYYQ